MAAELQGAVPAWNGDGDMLKCPICEKNKASFYRCHTEALGKLLARYPAIVNGVSEWRLLDEEPFTNRSRFDEFFRYDRYGLGIWAVWNAQAQRYERGFFEYDPFADYQKHCADQDLILIPVCVPCARKARTALGLKKYEFFEAFGIACPCCGYYTLSTGSRWEICPVCFWQDDVGDALDERSCANGITLRQAKENFASFGACDESATRHVRPPALDEEPRYHR